MDTLTVELNWSDLAKQAVEYLEGKIPYVGSLIAQMTDMLWPKNQISVWDQVKDQVMGLVDRKIIESEILGITDKLKAWKTNLDNYKEPPEGTKRETWLVSCLVEAEELFEACTSDPVDKRIHFIPLAVILTPLHLGLLKEQCQFAKEIYGDDCNSTFKDQLIKYCRLYKEFFNKVWEPWGRWRRDQIESFIVCLDDGQPLRRHWGVKDHEKVDYQTTPDPQDWVEYKDFRGCLWGITDEDRKDNDNWCAPIKIRMLNRAAADMAAVLSIAFDLDKCIPEPGDRPIVAEPPFSSFSLGPYSATTIGLSYSYQLKPTVHDKLGTITELAIREDDWTRAMQFTYSDHLGHRAGDPNPNPGGVHRSLTFEHNCTGMKIRFANAVSQYIPHDVSPGGRPEEYLQLPFICGIEVYEGGVPVSPPIGDWSRRSGQIINATVDKAFKLIGASFADGKQDLLGKRSGIEVIVLHFGRADKEWDFTS